MRPRCCMGTERRTFPRDECGCRFPGLETRVSFCELDNGVLQDRAKNWIQALLIIQEQKGYCFVKIAMHVRVTLQCIASLSTTSNPTSVKSN